MPARNPIAWASVSLLLLAWPVWPAEPEPGIAEDEAALKAAGVGVDTSALLTFFRDRTVSPASRQKLTDLVRQLGSDEFAARERASRDLIAAGRVAIPFLRRALQENDLEMVRRAERCLQAIDPQAETGLSIVAARLLGTRPSADAAGVLLAYLPSADDEVAAAAVIQTLTRLALRDGVPEPALAAAVKDKETICRAAAACALGRA